MHCLNKAMHIVSWCNGSTADSGSVCLGSNPSETTKKTADNQLIISHSFLHEHQQSLILFKIRFDIFFG